MQRPDEMWDVVTTLIQVATRADGKGQLNVAKQLRAAASSLVQAGAADLKFSDDPQLLAHDLRALAGRLERTDLDPRISERLAVGAEVIAKGGQTFIDEFPDPYVCRRCGLLASSRPSGHCSRCGAHALTFERFVPAYWITAYRPHEAMERLEENPVLFRAALDRFPADRMEWTPPGTAWSALDVMRHVRDAQSLLAQRVDLILNEKKPTLTFQAVFDLDGGGQESMDSIMATYIESRESSVSRLRDAELDDWNRTGVHEELGEVTLIDQASYFAAHELVHLRQLEQLRRRLDEVGG